jgi:site-specific DNA recombinase
MRNSPTVQTTGVAVGYARVSTGKQVEHGMSLQAQTAKINAMVAVQDVILLEIISDGESAKDTDRVGLQRLLALVDSGRVQTVIITKLDRLTRSVRDLADLLQRFERRHVSLVSVAESLDTGSAAGRLVLNIMTAVSQWEREAIGERTATVLQHKRDNGFVYSRLDPYGFRREGERLVPVDEEQSIIARIKLLRANGLSLRRIAGALNEDNIVTKQGNRWFAQTVADVLANPTNNKAA